VKTERDKRRGTVMRDLFFCVVEWFRRMVGVIASGSINIVLEACRRAYCDRITMIAAAAAVFVLLAAFPGIAALVLLYGIFADPGRRLTRRSSASGPA
jgi:uncharacterized BrkB/YihY/UPF0761 family membrane protein